MVSLNLGALIEKLTKDPRTFIGALVIICSFVTMPIVFAQVPELRNMYFTGVMFLLFTVVSYYFSAKTGERVPLPPPIVAPSPVSAPVTKEMAEEFMNLMIEKLGAYIADLLKPPPQPVTESD